MKNAEAKVEAISHMLYDCTNAKDLWDRFTKGIMKYIHDTSFLGRSSILLIDYCNPESVNLSLLITKYDIIKSS